MKRSGSQHILGVQCQTVHPVRVSRVRAAHHAIRSAPHLNRAILRRCVQHTGTAPSHRRHSARMTAQHAHTLPQHRVPDAHIAIGAGTRQQSAVGVLMVRLPAQPVHPLLVAHQRFAAAHGLARFRVPDAHVARLAGARHASTVR